MLFNQSRSESTESFQGEVTTATPYARYREFRFEGIQIGEDKSDVEQHEPI